MTEREINYIIASYCGFQVHIPGIVKDSWLESVLNDVTIPDYSNDLNAMHEAEEIGLRLIGGKTPQQARDEYYKRVCEEVGGYEEDRHRLVMRAKAHQRAKAFVKTAGKWKKS